MRTQYSNILLTNQVDLSHLTYEYDHGLLQCDQVGNQSEHSILIY